MSNYTRTDTDNISAKKAGQLMALWATPVPEVATLDRDRIRAALRVPEDRRTMAERLKERASDRALLMRGTARATARSPEFDAWLKEQPPEVRRQIAVAETAYAKELAVRLAVADGEFAELLGGYEEPPAGRGPTKGPRDGFDK